MTWDNMGKAGSAREKNHFVSSILREKHSEYGCLQAEPALFVQELRRFLIKAHAAG
jgi:hypothetical protein